MTTLLRLIVTVAARLLSPGALPPADPSRKDAMISNLMLVLLWVGVATVGDICCKTTRGFATWRFAAAVSCYALCAVFAVVAFGRRQWGWVLIAWNGVNLAVGVWLSVYYFREPLTLKRAIAAALVSVAVFIAE